MSQYELDICPSTTPTQETRGSLKEATKAQKTVLREGFSPTAERLSAWDPSIQVGPYQLRWAKLRGAFRRIAYGTPTYSNIEGLGAKRECLSRKSYEVAAPFQDDVFAKKLHKSTSLPCEQSFEGRTELYVWSRQLVRDKAWYGPHGGWGTSVWCQPSRRRALSGVTVPGRHLAHPPVRLTTPWGLGTFPFLTIPPSPA